MLIEIDGVHSVSFCAHTRTHPLSLSLSLTATCEYSECSGVLDIHKYKSTEREMASSTAKITFRVAMALLVISLLFYVGRPLYWKISATVHDIRHNKKTVGQGISQIVQDAQRSVVGWYHDESDSGLHEDRTAKKVGVARRLLIS